MQWKADRGIGGWRVRSGEPYKSQSWATFQPDQFGRVRSMGLTQHPATLPQIQRAAAVAKCGFAFVRFGTKYSRVRGDLCEAIAAELNKAS